MLTTYSSMNAKHPAVSTTMYSHRAKQLQQRETLEYLFATLCSPCMLCVCAWWRGGREGGGGRGEEGGRGVV